MSNRIYLRPTTRGGVIIDPDNGHIMPQHGAWVPNNRYWRRLRRAGDVCAARPPTKPRKKAPRARKEAQS